MNFLRFLTRLFPDLDPKTFKENWTRGAIEFEIPRKDEDRSPEIILNKKLADELSQQLGENWTMLVSGGFESHTIYFSRVTFPARPE